MAMDIFLKLDGIKGEAQDKKHKDQIDILSWSWGMQQSGTTHMGSGAGSGKVNVQDVTITKYVDKASPPLAQHCCSGKHIGKGTLIFRKAGDNPLEYVTLEMSDLLVSAVTMGGTETGDRLTENVTLNFAKFDYKYVTQTQDGSAGPSVEAGWNIAQNASA